jgi:hypothetical protein
LASKQLTGHLALGFHKDGFQWAFIEVKTENLILVL